MCQPGCCFELPFDSGLLSNNKTDWRKWEGCNRGRNRSMRENIYPVIVVICMMPARKSRQRMSYLSSLPQGTTDRGESRSPLFQKVEEARSHGSGWQPGRISSRPLRKDCAFQHFLHPFHEVIRFERLLHEFYAPFFLQVRPEGIVAVPGHGDHGDVDPDNNYLEGAEGREKDLVKSGRCGRKGGNGTARIVATLTGPFWASLLPSPGACSWPGA